ITLNLAATKYTNLTFSTQDNVTLVVNGVPGTILDPATPALTVTSGKVIVENVTFTEFGDAPTILVTGGNLTLRNDIVQESTGFNDPAIKITGGSLDLGTPTSPGGNTINVNGTGQVLLSTGTNVVTTVGTSFQVNGVAVSPCATVGLASSANPSIP